MLWQVRRLAIRSALALGLGAAVFLTLSNLQREGFSLWWFGVALMLFVYVALGASILTLVRILCLVLCHLTRPEPKPARRQGALSLFRGHVIVLVGGAFCLSSVPLVSQLASESLFFAGLFLMSLGWAFGSVGQPPVSVDSAETIGA